MDIEEMKLAVCEKLSGEISIQNGKFYWITPYYGCFDESDKIKWLTEGLQVCHEAEKLLRPKYSHPTSIGLEACDISHEWEAWGTYTKLLADISGDDDGIHATYEQRLESLCRVWYPEKFTSET